MYNYAHTTCLHSSCLAQTDLVTDTPGVWNTQGAGKLRELMSGRSSDSLSHIHHTHLNQHPSEEQYLLPPPCKKSSSECLSNLPKTQSLALKHVSKLVIYTASIHIWEHPIYSRLLLNLSQLPLVCVFHCFLHALPQLACYGFNHALSFQLWTPSRIAMSCPVPV